MLFSTLSHLRLNQFLGELGLVDCHVASVPRNGGSGGNVTSARWHVMLIHVACEFPWQGGDIANCYIRVTLLTCFYLTKFS